ncbi:MAG: DNA-binding protein [Candidatus Omnitrophota bacterium]
MSHVTRHMSHVKIFLKAILIIISTCYLLPVTCYSQVSSSDLINNAKQYDGKEIVYSGEVIGDVMVRGNFAWINVNDTKNAIGIWLPRNLAKEISITGSYEAKGDIVEVKGKFNRVCIEHGGDLDVHAYMLNVIKKGKNVDEVISPRKIKVAIAFLIICLTLAVIYFIRLFYSKRR